MAKQTIAILSPGDMGHAVGRAVLSLGHEVVTTLAGRSERTRALSAKAGLTALADLEAVVAEADLVLSILPPEAAQANAREIAEAMRRADVCPPVAGHRGSPDREVKRLSARATFSRKSTSCWIGSSAKRASSTSTSPGWRP